MQDVQNIPNPDVNSVEDDGDFGTHSDMENPKDEIPTPPDRQPTAPVEEPPETQENPPVGDRSREPRRIM